MLRRGPRAATSGLFAHRDSLQRSVLLPLPPEMHGVRPQRFQPEGIVQTRSARTKIQQQKRREEETKN